MAAGARAAGGACYAASATQSPSHTAMNDNQPARCSGVAVLERGPARQVARSLLTRVAMTSSFTLNEHSMSYSSSTQQDLLSGSRHAP